MLLTVVYIDVLLAINLTLDYFLLFGTARLAGAEFARLRCLCSAAMGALYSMIILFPIKSTVLIILSRLIVSAVMVLIGFGKRNISEFVRLLLIFYICSFTFSGFIMMINHFADNDIFLIKNGAVYFEISAVEIVISAALACIATELLRRLFRHGEPEGKCLVKLFYNGKYVVLKGFTDTGNGMTDPFTGSPVAICRGKDISAVLPDTVLENCTNYDLSTKVRYLPYKTVSGSAVIPIIRPEKLEIIMNGASYEAEDILIGLSENAPVGTILLGKNIILKQSGKIFSEVR